MTTSVAPQPKVVRSLVASTVPALYVACRAITEVTRLRLLSLQAQRGEEMVLASADHLISHLLQASPVIAEAGS